MVIKKKNAKPVRKKPISRPKSTPKRGVQRAKRPVKKTNIKQRVTKSNLDIHKTTKNILDKTQKKSSKKLDLGAIKRQIESEIKGGHIEKHEGDVLETRAPAAHAIEKDQSVRKVDLSRFIQTGVPGFDELFEHGIPKGSAVIMAGGAGSGKTIMALQTLMHHCEKGKKCFYMSFEESEERLVQHMEDFGWPAKKYIKKGVLKIK